MQYVNIPVYSGGQKKKDVITKTSYIHKTRRFFFLTALNCARRHRIHPTSNCEIGKYDINQHLAINTICLGFSTNFKKRQNIAHQQ